MKIKFIITFLLTLLSFTVKSQDGQKLIDGIMIGGIKYVPPSGAGGAGGSVSFDTDLLYKNSGLIQDSLITVAVDSLALDLATFQSGANKYKSKNLRKNNGRLDLFPPSNFATIPDGTLWRGFTTASNDTTAINSLNGVVVRFEGQGANNAGYITGEFGQWYAKKISNDTLQYFGDAITGYSYTPPVSNFYVEQSNANASNTGGTGSFVSDQGGTFSAVTEDGFPAIRVFPAESGNNDASGIRLVQSFVDTWSNNTLTLAPGDVLEISFDFKGIGAGAVQVWTGSNLTPFNGLGSQSSFTPYTFQITVPAGGYTGSAGLYFVADIVTPFVSPLFIKNLVITKL